MPDVQISDLQQLTGTPGTNDLLLIRNGSQDYKIQYSDIKAAITANTLFIDPNGTITDVVNPYYNKSEVNTLVSGLQDQIDTVRDDAFLCTLGTRIPANSDLDSYITPGTYYVNSAADAASLFHTPITGHGFKLLVLEAGYHTNTGNYNAQIAIASNGSVNRIYIRGRSSSAWNDVWQEVAYKNEFAVSQVSSPITWSTTNTDAENSSCSIYAMGKLRFLAFRIKPLTGNGNSWVTYGTIASGNRPVEEFYTIGSVVTGSEFPATRVIVRTSGGIQMQNPGIGGLFCGSVMYFVP